LPFDPQPLDTPAKPHVRYAGFESIKGGRRLQFSVKSVGQESVEIAIEISDAAFTAAPGISIQDAAPMAYEKILKLLARQHIVNSNELCLTDADIAQYITRSSQFTETRVFTVRRKVTISHCGLIEADVSQSSTGFASSGLS
jgi:hypothetical protein